MIRWKSKINIILFFLFGFNFLVSSYSWAHESRPLYVEVKEVKPDLFSVKWKSPRSIPVFNIPELLLPDNCVQTGNELAVTVSDAFIRQSSYQCPGGMAGRKVGVDFPVINPSVSTLFRIQMLSGEKHTKLLNPGENIWQIPESENRLQVAKEYTLLGIRHILKGVDHLLFLVCLLVVAGTGRRILITITGFTLAHSATLILSALNLFRVPVPPVEAAIALSIVFLATEIAKGSRETLTYRYPITVSTSFGLLHGLGFAAVLKEIGLPQTEIPTSLLFFNLGVEIGQILFVGCLIIIFRGIQVITLRLNKQAEFSVTSMEKLEKTSAYIVGSLASFWMFERMYSFWF